MRVLGFFGVLLVAAVVGVVPAVAQPGRPFDVAELLGQLDDEQLVRAPGSPAYFDEARVRAELTPDLRVLVLPYIDYELYEDGEDNRYFDDVMVPITEWGEERNRSIVVVEGVDVRLAGVRPPVSLLDHDLPADLPELRTTTSTRDVTERVLVFAKLGKGVPPDAAEEVLVDHPEPVPPTPEQLDLVASALTDNRVHNGPGRQNRVENPTPKDVDLDVRVAAFPYLAPGQPVVDYAPGLAARFPDDVVLVLHGDWLDIIAADQAKALSARDYVYGDATLGLLPSSRSADLLLREVLERYDFLLAETAYGRPQPPPQPRPSPFDVQNTVASVAPWVLVGAALVLGGTGLGWHRRRTAAAARTEARELRAESAAATAAIGDLGARLLAREERGDTVDPAAAERHATARLLYDQALTAAAMVEVRAVAEDGLELLADTPEPEKKERPAKKPAKRRKKRNRDGSLTRAERTAQQAAKFAQRQREWEQRSQSRKKPPKRWFGIPRWVYVPIVLGGVLGYLVFGRPAEPPPPPSAQVVKAVEGLRTASVYEEPGGPGFVNVEKARALIGDRAIVLVLYAGELLDDPNHFTEPREERCADIAELVATSVVIMYAFDDDGDYAPEYCVGPEFANDDNPVDPSDYGRLGGVVGSVSLGTPFRVTATDRFAEVEEYVYAFDEYTTRDSPNGVPRRGVVVPPADAPTGPQTWQVALSLAGILAGTLAVFVLLRAAGRRISGRGERAAAARTSAEVVNTRLNRLADTILHPERPKDAGAARVQADLAERYVLLLRAAENARTPEDVAAVALELDELENAGRS